MSPVSDTLTSLFQCIYICATFLVLLSSPIRCKIHTHTESHATRINARDSHYCQLFFCFFINFGLGSRTGHKAHHPVRERLGFHGGEDYALFCSCLETSQICLGKLSVTHAHNLHFETEIGCFVCSFDVS